MDNEKYKEYLQSDKWKRIKAKVISRDKGTCQGCFFEVPLDVHHLTYKRIGEELGTDLVSLCRRCHDEIHIKNKDSRDRGDWHRYIKGLSKDKPKDVSKMTREERIYRILRETL